MRKISDDLVCSVVRKVLQDFLENLESFSKGILLRKNYLRYETGKKNKLPGSR